MKNPFIHTSLKESHPDSFVHLHLHTQYSLLDGAIRLDDLFNKCKELGMPAVASTDHGNMFGAIDFYTKALKAGIKPIIGSEIYFTPGSRFDRREPKNSATLDSQDEMESKHQIHHLVLLCKNMTGYKNLCKLLSKAYLEGFYYKPRVDIEILKEYSEGLVATTACLKGEVAYNLFTDQFEKAVSAVDKLHAIFKDDFYLEIQENTLPEQALANKKLLEIAASKNIPLVATNDAHYLTREDARAQEVLLCIQTGKTFNDEKRMKLTSNEFYVKSPEEMRHAFSYMKEACDNTLVIADKCNLEFTWHDEKGNQIYHLPDFKTGTDESVEDYFSRLSLEGLYHRFKGPHFRKLVTEQNWETEIQKMYIDRLHDEVKMIIQTGFAGYFLIVSDFIRWAKKNGIPVGPGRGSGAGSLVAYSLDITNIDPIPFNLLFERFINPERVSMPDFDVDFCQDRRQEVINYVTHKYGAENVGQIITFGKLQAKAVVRDVSRVFGLPYSEADFLAKLIPDELGIKLQEAIDKEPKLAELENTDPKIKQILGISKRLEGLMRHASIHAAGVIITSEPLVEYCPLFKGREGEQVVQFDKDFAEKIGLVKFDFLGLKTLTVIEHASQFIRRDVDEKFDIEDVDLEDPSVYQLIAKGDNTGVFQLESAGMKELCKRIIPDCMDDITAINALYRPGPMKSGMHEEFILRKHGTNKAQYLFPELEPVLKDTLGIIIYQEQVMNISRIVAGYSLGQADMLRRAMGKKKADEMEKHQAIFCEGAKKNGYDEKKAEELFNLMANFAEYGFNKSHAVAYAYIAYHTAYLKKYYPSAFFAALLGSEMGNADKITKIIQDVNEHQIKVLPPDINESLWLFNVVGDNIRFGMGAIKNVGENAVGLLIAERVKNGDFKSFLDFCERVDLRLCNKRVLESLIQVGAFDNCDKNNRKTLLHNLEKIVAYAQKRQEDKNSSQASFFDLADSLIEEETVQIDEVPDFDMKEKLAIEKNLMGIYISGHPLHKYRGVIEQLASMGINDVHEIKGDSKREMVLVGMISELKVLMTKKGDKMAFAMLEGLDGKIECVIFPRTYSEFEPLLGTDEPLLISGAVNLAENPRKFFPTKITKLESQADSSIKNIMIEMKEENLNPYTFQNLKRLTLDYRGTVPVIITIENALGKVDFDLGEEYLVNPTAQFSAKVNELIGTNAVQYIMTN